MQQNWLDDVASALSERASRRLSRRGVMAALLDVAYKGTLIVTFGMAAGREAFAYHCNCSPPNNQYCDNCPSDGGCPSGDLHVCTTGNGYQCIYNTGYWTDDCGGGTFVYCYDCGSDEGGYYATCGCKSAIQNGGGGGGCDPCSCGNTCKDCGSCGNCCGNSCCI